MAPARSPAASGHPSATSSIPASNNRRRQPAYAQPVRAALGLPPMAHPSDWCARRRVRPPRDRSHGIGGPLADTGRGAGQGSAARRAATGDGRSTHCSPPPAPAHRHRARLGGRSGDDPLPGPPRLRAGDPRGPGRGPAERSRALAGDARRRAAPAAAHHLARCAWAAPGARGWRAARSGNAAAALRADGGPGADQRRRDQREPGARSGGTGGHG